MEGRIEFKMVTGKKVVNILRAGGGKFYDGELYENIRDPLVEIDHDRGSRHSWVGLLKRLNRSKS